eukprot:COSAG01_NODE_7274_length_3274_cov_2.216063_6_plen_46_part_00
MTTEARHVTLVVVMGGRTRYTYSIHYLFVSPARKHRAGAAMPVLL